MMTIRRTITPAAALLVAALLSTPVHAAMQSDIPYGADPQQKLDICLPPGTGTAAPALIMIHGGAWRIGDKKNWDDICEMAAAEGMVGIAVNYRLADGTQAHAWPAQLVDAQLTIRWVRSRAAQYGLDPHHICAIGDSAGGHLTMFLAALDKIAPGDYADQLADVSPKVDCAVDWFGTVDLTGDLAKFPNMQKMFVGVTPGHYAEVEHAASPLFAVGPRTAPTLIVQGDEDKAVDISLSQSLHKALTQSGVPNQLWVYHGGHEFEGAKDKIPAYVEGALAFFKDPLVFLKENHPPPQSP